MKKVLVALVLSMSVSMSAQADSLAGPFVFFVAGYIAAAEKGKPVPFHLTEACKVQTVQAKGGNYSYISYEHCQNK